MWGDRNCLHMESMDVLWCWISFYPQLSLLFRALGLSQHPRGCRNRMLRINQLEGTLTCLCRVNIPKKSKLAN